MEAWWDFMASRKVITTDLSSSAPHFSTPATAPRLVSTGPLGITSSDWRFLARSVGVHSVSLVVFVFAFERPPLPFAESKRFPSWLQCVKFVAKAHRGACPFLTPTCAQSVVGARIFSVSAPLLKVHHVASTHAPHASSPAKSSRPAAKGTHAGSH
jgi:hypothetical protein